MMRRTATSVALVIAAVVATTSVAGAKGGPQVLTDREEVVFRTTEDGIRVRVVTGDGPEEFDAQGVCDGPGCLPKRCQPVRAAYLAASTREAVGEGYFDVYRSDGDEPIVFLAGGSFGGIVERPVGWVVARVGQSVERVDASFVNGGRDSVAPKDGFAVVAAPVDEAGTFDGQVAPVRLVARDADGDRIGRLLVRRDTPWSSPASTCGVGTLADTFPEPTGRVPADSTAAEAAVVDAFRVAYSGVGPDAEALSSVEDGDSLREVAQIASDRYPQYAGTLTAEVAEVRFVDEDEAAVRFELGVPGAGSIVSGVGTAVRRDDRWVVARETFCAVLAVGGVYCPIDEPVKRST
jgi:hypothetical protein